MESVATTTLLSALVYLVLGVSLAWFGGVGGDIVRYVDGAFEENADGHFGDGLDAGFLVALDFVHADIVLAIAGCCYRCHCCLIISRGFRKTIEECLVVD